MRASVIQLKQVLFQRIEVEAVEPEEGTALDEAVAFDFDGIAFRVSLDVGAGPTEDGRDPRTFVIVLGIAIDQTEEKPSPYKLDIAALGLVEVSEMVETEKRRDLALVNGASLVYGAIRELVTTLTARCIAGPLVLPTADFRDHSEILFPATEPDATTKQSPQLDAGKQP